MAVRLRLCNFEYYDAATATVSNTFNAKVS